MPGYDLEPIFNPKSIAIVGASRDASSVGQGILRNLAKGCVFHCSYCKPFKGKIFPVNPKAKSIRGRKCYPDINSIEEDVDLAIIAVPAKAVPKVMKECAQKKVTGAIVVSAGFAEFGEKGKKLQQETVKIAEDAGIPVVGPNCLGVIRPTTQMNASFAPSMPPSGSIAFVSQSGALADSIIDWAIEERYGFSAIVSYGNKAMLDAEDFLNWLADDPHTKAIAMYIEGVNDGRRFMRIASKVAAKKPVVALKAGKTGKGASAVSSHTGSLAGSYEIFRAALRQSGIMEAETVEDLFDMAKALAHQPGCSKNAVAIVTNGGGCGVLTADYCAEQGINLVDLKEKTLKKLDRSGKMHPAYSRRNPLDIVGDALPERYEAAINTLLSEDYISGMIVLQTLQTMTDVTKDAEVVIKARRKFPDKPIICTYMGGRFSEKGKTLLEKNGIPDYNDPRKAVRAMKALIEKGRS
ncbi:hypothetical protein GF351_05665 [Candidatus Woesearchaeota archaeon]|nr:hypothetical protein [Candidatus Woesearchaeota archaeon]